MFALLLIAFVVFAALTKYTTTSDPAVQAGRAFLTAIAKSDVAAVKRLTDPETATVTSAGRHITGIQFKEFVPFAGANVRQDPVQLYYLDLKMLREKPGIPPRVTDNMATFTLENGHLMYLRRFGTEWKVSYITQ